MQARPRLNHIALIVAIAAIVGLGVMIILSPHRLVYDENGNLSNVREVLQVGWHAALTSPASLSAAGPLFTAVQLGCEPLTKLQAPAIRFPNFCLFVGLFFLLGGMTRSLRLANPMFVALSVIAVPFVWASVGMALTELPALFCFTAGTWLCVELAKNENALSLGRRLTFALGAGVLLGLACLGRQTYLVTLAGLFALFRRETITWVSALMVGIVLVLVAGWLFWIWGGLSPPSLKHINAGVRWSHAVLSFAYLGLATLFIEPRWFVEGRPISLTKSSILIYGSCGIAVAIGLAFPFTPIVPAHTLIRRLIPAVLSSWCPRLVSAFVAGFAWLWLIRFWREFWLVRKERQWVFLYVVLFLLGLTPMAISHQFSSRYVLMSISLLVLILGKMRAVIGWAYIARLIIGASLGAAILKTYFSQSG